VSPDNDNELESRVLASRPMVLVLFASVFTMVGFYLLLSVVPLYAEAAGGGSSGAGLATAVFMLSTVLAQVGMPRVLARFGYRAVLMAGLLLLGLPAFLYLSFEEVPAILAVTLVRGAGFGAAIVALAALVAELAPPGRRGEALGLYGVALTLPTVFCGALGLWIVERSGFALVFLIGALSPLLAFAAALGIPSDRYEEGAGFLSLFGRPALLRVFVLFTSCTAASPLGARTWALLRRYGSAAPRSLRHLLPLVGGALRRPPRPPCSPRPRPPVRRARDGGALP
jgi:MFS family permease